MTIMLKVSGSSYGKRTSAGEHNNLAPSVILGGTQVSFWYECATRRIENRGLRECTAAKFGVLKN